MFHYTDHDPFFIKVNCPGRFTGPIFLRGSTLRNWRHTVDRKWPLSLKLSSKINMMNGSATQLIEAAVFRCIAFGRGNPGAFCFLRREHTRVAGGCLELRRMSLQSLLGNRPRHSAAASEFVALMLAIELSRTLRTNVPSAKCCHGTGARCQSSCDCESTSLFMFNRRHRSELHDRR